MEVLTPLPIYFVQFQNLMIAISAHYVNSFGKTVRANQLDLSVFLIEDDDGGALTIANYERQTGRLDILLPRNFPTDFSSSRRYVEVFLRGEEAIRISPVFAGTVSYDLCDSNTLLYCILYAQPPLLFLCFYCMFRHYGRSKRPQCHHPRRSSFDLFN